MESVESIIVHDRQHAGRMLAQRLHEYKNGNGVVVGIPRGGVLVAAAIAEELNLPLDILPCRKIGHPADSLKSLGSVSTDELILHNVDHDLPQDYLLHQLAMLRHGVNKEDLFYHDYCKPVDLTGKTVILVNDLINTFDAISSCLKSIIKKDPSRIIVACPVVSEDAASNIEPLAGEVVFLRMEHELNHGESFFQEFPLVDERLVKETLLKSKKTFGLN